MNTINPETNRVHFPVGQNVVIRIAAGGQMRTVFEEYPLTNLLTYSSRARKNLAQQAKATWDGATLQWIVNVKNNKDLEISGIKMLLNFWKSLRPHGFVQNYLALPGANRVEIPDSVLAPLSQIELLYLHDAYLELQPAYPLDNRKPRNCILEIISHPGALGSHSISTLWNLFSNVDTALVERACLSFINGFGLEYLEDMTLMEAYNDIPELYTKLTRMQNERLDVIHGVKTMRVTNRVAIDGGGLATSEPKNLKRRMNRRGDRSKKVAKEVDAQNTAKDNTEDNEEAV